MDEWLTLALDLGLITAHGANKEGVHCVRWIGGEVTSLEWAQYCHRLKELRELHSTKKQEKQPSWGSPRAIRNFWIENRS